MKKSLILLVALILSQKAFSAVYSDEPGSFVDPRKHVSKAKWPKFNAVGFLKVQFKSPVPDPRSTPEQIENYKPGKSYTGGGTAFLIDECHIVTNDHVALQVRKESEFTLEKYEFKTGPNHEFKSGAKLIANGRYMTTNDNGSDWAILKLDQNVFDPKNKSDPRAGWQIKPEFVKLEDISYESVRDPGNLISASYYQDIPSAVTGEKLYAHLGCTVWNRSPFEGLWRTNCAAIPGVSGAPVFGEKDKVQGAFVAYGVMVKGHHKDGEYKLPEFQLNSSLGNGMLGFSEMKESNGKFLTPERLKQILNTKQNRCSQN